MLTNLLAVHHITKGNISMPDHYVIQAAESGPHLLIVGGVHGDEYEPIVAALQLVDELPGLLSKGQVTIMPLANESAFRHGSRLGIDTKDLARICPGDIAGTVTEQSAAIVSKLITTADFLIDMHTGGALYDIYPLAGYMMHTDPKVLMQQQQMAVAAGLPLIWGTDHRPDGRTLSVARDSNIPAVYFEYGGGSAFREHVVSSYKEACMRIMAHLGMFEADYRVPGSRFNYWLEDERQDSGYLQVKMPSPATGIFIPLVATGQLIRKGQLFGEVINPIENESTMVIAEQDGLVFLVRVNTHVEAGDSLGGILEVELFNKTTIKDDAG